VIADAGRHIGIAAASLCNLLDPGLIVVGGELAEAGEILMAPMRHSLERTALAAGNGLPEIVASSFGEWTETPRSHRGRARRRRLRSCRGRQRSRSRHRVSGR
jgi:predicted NBD/HSP70 family sugar kinase